jgi:hypothetical protein
MLFRRRKRNVASGNHILVLNPSSKTFYPSATYSINYTFWVFSISRNFINAFGFLRDFRSRLTETYFFFTCVISRCKMGRVVFFNSHSLFYLEEGRGTSRPEGEAGD